MNLKLRLKTAGLFLALVGILTGVVMLFVGYLALMAWAYKETGVWPLP